MECMSNKNNEPYAALGERLKFLREQWQQTVHDVCGTLEIEESTLSAIEAGKTLPPVEVLDMFINHFLLTEEQAEDLRELADLQREQVNEALASGIDDMLMKQMAIFMPIDNRAVYTDSMQANVNDHGVMLQFMQQLPGVGQPVVVSRIGMSRNHAERAIQVLQATLLQYDQGKEQQSLPSPKNKK